VPSPCPHGTARHGVARQGTAWREIDACIHVPNGRWQAADARTRTSATRRNLTRSSHGAQCTDRTTPQPYLHRRHICCASPIRRTRGGAKRSLLAQARRRCGVG
jgi:hypothetical protein